MKEVRDKNKKQTKRTLLTEEQRQQSQPAFLCGGENKKALE